jgi:RNA-directed DNA polymerase
VPTVADRIAQTAVKMWLEPQLDPVFHDDSFGYRPGKSALEAIAGTRRRCWDYDWVVEFDIRGLFDNLDHGLLMTAAVVAGLSNKIERRRVGQQLSRPTRF